MTSAHTSEHVSVTGGPERRASCRRVRHRVLYSNGETSMSCRYFLLRVTLIVGTCLAFGAGSVEAAPTFGTSFLFPDSISVDSSIPVNFCTGVCLDIGVNSITDVNGVSSAVAQPSQASLANIQLFSQGGVFNGFWSNLVPLPTGSQAGTSYTIFATNTLNQTSSLTIPNKFTPLPAGLVPAQHIAYGSTNGQTTVSWDRVFVGGVEVSEYQVRISQQNSNGTIGTTFFTASFPPTSVAQTSTRAAFVVPTGVVSPGQTVEFSIGAAIQNSQGAILDRSRNFAAFTTIQAGGSSQSYPILPTGFLPGSFRFVSVATGSWFDPTTAPGFHYVMESAGSLFTEILNFPTGFISPFEVFSGGIDFGSFGPGTQLIFPGSGVSEFTVAGIQPLVDANNPIAFPLQLQFSTPTASFDMIALTPVPGPATLILLTLGISTMGGITWRHRAKRSSGAYSG